MTSPKITDRTLEVLASLPRLREVSLIGEKLTDSGIGRLRACHALESIQIRGRNLSGRGFADLASLPKLREVKFYGCYNIDDDGVNALGRLPHLQTLHLIHDPENCEHRCRLDGTWPHMQDLSMWNAEMTRSDWKSLGRLAELTSLDVMSTNVSDEDLVEFSSLARLQDLSLSGTRVTSEGVARLERLSPTLTIYWDPH